MIPTAELQAMVDIFKMASSVVVTVGDKRLGIDPNLMIELAEHIYQERTLAWAARCGELQAEIDRLRGIMRQLGIGEIEVDLSKLDETP